MKEEKVVDKNVSHVPIKDITKVMSDSVSTKIAERKIKSQNIVKPVAPVAKEPDAEPVKEVQSDIKSDGNVSKKMKFSESRKSPVIGSFTPMTFHSTPNKEGIPLTKTMVDQQLHPNRHSDNVKKTIEVHTDCVKQRTVETPGKPTKDSCDDNDKQLVEKDITDDKSNLTSLKQDPKVVEETVNSQTTVDTKKNEEVVKEKGEKYSPEKDREVLVTPNVINEANTPSLLQKSEEVDSPAVNKNLDLNKDIDSSETKDITVIEEDKTKKTVQIEENSSPAVSETKQSEPIKENKSIKPAINEEKVSKETNKAIEVVHLQEGKEEHSVQDDIEPKQNIETELKSESEVATNLKQQETVNLIPSNQKDSEIIKIDSTDPSSVHRNAEVETSKESTTKEDKKGNDDKAIGKVTESEVKPESNEISKDQESKVIQLDKDNNDSKIQNADQNISEIAKIKTAVIQSALEPAKAKDIKIADKGPEESLNPESNTNVTNSEPKKLGDIVEKISSFPNKSSKIIASQLSNKPVVDAVIIPKSKSAISSEPLKTSSQIEMSNVKAKEEKEIKKQDCKPVIEQDAKQNIPRNKIDSIDKRTVPKVSVISDQKPINNNHAAVPFGKWTEVNRQAFLNKIKESKVPTNSSNGKQIKNSNDLNRRDVLKKIDSQRQAQELANMNRLGVKKETVFTNKTPSVPRDNKTTVKTEIPILKNNSTVTKKITKQEPVAKPQTVTTNTLTTAVKKETIQRKEINNQDLIDKTIEGIINRALPAKTSQEETNQTTVKDSESIQKSNDISESEDNALDEQLAQIEMKMNELHGIPFIERPAHELPYIQKTGNKSLPKSEVPKATVNKPSKIPNLLPFGTKIQKGIKENLIDVDSEEEVIEHEPITGDMDLTKKNIIRLPILDQACLAETVTLISADSSKRETIITENDFDKFVRRNSINYENCLTVNFDSKEPHHNVVQTIVQKDSSLRTYSKAETRHSESKVLSPRKHEQFNQSSITKPIQNITKFGNLITEDDGGKNYQSKVKMAYQTAMTAKRQLERPITIIEDRPVKVVYMDPSAEYIPTLLNVQGQELSPSKKMPPSSDLIISHTSDSLDSDTLDSIDEGKLQDECKVKSKHQRKQVLTPVETPELELIAPDDLGIEVSPKKKRRTEEKVEKSNSKILVPKKTYLLGRGNTNEDTISKPFDLSKNSQKESQKADSPIVSHKNTASAIDSLVKAAELLETQSVSIVSKAPDILQTPDSLQNTPAKRGRGRPRKYPVPEGTTDTTKAPSPQKKPRLIDAKVVKNKDESDDDDDTSDDELVKENWTMGKINENIVCPICNKLFRSENVVFKHVKHCTGPSPSRSESDNKSPRRLRDSQESESKSIESKSDEMNMDETESSHKDIRKKRKSKDSQSKSAAIKDEVIVIEDTPIKAKPDKRDETKPPDTRKMLNKNKMPDKVTSLVCEFCGKTFRQLSYLVSHKLQHVKDDKKKNEDSKANRSVFSCEVCKKEFRKLHHLVHHRIIHNPNSTTAKLSRKSSSEQNDNKSSKDQNLSKQNDDLSAGFRCEPCDKSFRKLHHLVEHRETHDGINRQKVTSTVSTNSEKLPPPPQCDICKKTFRKLHHLIEHKEQHLETSSEKSDDKSIKSSLSTKDIIHECSLCYMVFPNEHSLNKHTIICQRKKRQSATKQIKQVEEGEKAEEDSEIAQSEGTKPEKDDDVTVVTEEVAEEKSEKQETIALPVEIKIKDENSIEKNPIKSVEKSKTPTPVLESPKAENATDKSDGNRIVETVEPKPKIGVDLPNIPAKVKKTDGKESNPKCQDTPRKKTPLKDKVGHTITKRHKPNLPLPVIEDVKPVETSDDDEIRYMLNPDYKFQENEGKLFMKVRANKRNSLQIERPNSKDLVKRRISLQHPPKVPRLKQKTVQNKTVSSNATISTKAVVNSPKPEPVPSSDSDDSDIKYSFPETPTEKVSKPAKNLAESTSKDPSKKTHKKTLAEKRKSLSSIAKRKSLGKAVAAIQKVKASPLKQVRKRKYYQLSSLLLWYSGHLCVTITYQCK